MGFWVENNDLVCPEHSGFYYDAVILGLGKYA